MSFNPILKRVLIYNPNPLLAESLCNGLELCGPFTTKACGRGLMETLVEFRPNIVVLDPGHLPVAPELWKAEVERHADVARAHLAPLPEGEAKDALLQVCTDLVERDA